MNHKDLHLSRNPQEYNEALEYREEVWNRFRDYSPADLSALKETASNRRKLFFEQYEYAKEQDYQDDMEYWREQHRKMVIIHDVLGALYSHHLNHGTYPPKYEKRRKGKARDNVAFSDLPPRTRHYFNVAAGIEGITDEPLVSNILREVADLEDDSQSTVYKWMCERNPRYVAKETEEKRLNSILKVIRSIIASREVSHEA